jgi:prepilin-type N-terminal cleavage/methylation domain-containing protein
MRESEPTSGFTLIETLVALTIFVAGYVVVHQSVMLAWRGAQIAWTEEAAVRLAQSQLAAAGVATRLQEGEERGETPDGFVWTRRVELYRPPPRADEPTSDPAGRIAGYWVTVTVRWRGGLLQSARSLQLKTLKLAATGTSRP